MIKYKEDHNICVNILKLLFNVDSFNDDVLCKSFVFLLFYDIRWPSAWALSTKHIHDK